MRRLATAAALLAVAACGSKSADEPKIPDEVKATLAKKDAIAERVAELRQLSLKAPVVAAYQTQAEYAEYIERAIDREFPAAELALLERIAYRFGFVKRRIDLKRAAVDAMSGDTMAYYDPERGTFYVLAAVESDVTAAHELLHGIQDQHFDLQRYYGIDARGKQTLTESVASARQFVVEGEASLIEQAYRMAEEGEDLLGDRALLQEAIEAVRAETKLDSFMLGLEGGDLEFFMLPMYAAYTQGFEAVATVYLHGGWPAVAELYTRPPESSEQVLHPDKLLGERDLPVALELPKAIGDWRRVEDDVLGELGWRSYFLFWRVPEAVAAAAGWDGDFVGYYARADALVMIARTTWDSPEDAAEFAGALRAAAAKRFPDAKDLTRPDGTKLVIRVDGADVLFVDGAPPDLVLPDRL